jgi:hypothetical protein
LSALAASIAQAALALAALWSLDAQVSIMLSLRHGGPLLFAAGCIDPSANMPHR